MYPLYIYLNDFYSLNRILRHQRLTSYKKKISKWATQGFGISHWTNRALRFSVVRRSPVLAPHQEANGCPISIGASTSANLCPAFRQTPITRLRRRPSCRFRVCVCLTVFLPSWECVCGERGCVFVLSLSDNCSFLPLQWHPKKKKSSSLRKWAVVTRSPASTRSCCHSFRFSQSRLRPQTPGNTFGTRWAPLESKEKKERKKRMSSVPGKGSSPSRRPQRWGLENIGEKNSSVHTRVCIFVLNRTNSFISDTDNTALNIIRYRC